MTSSLRLAVLSALSLCLALPPGASADQKDFYFRRKLNRALEQEMQSPFHGLFFPFVPIITPQAGVMEQLIDHADPAAGTFSQRYYIASDFATAGTAAPILFYVCGESTCEPTYVRGALSVHAKALGAHMVALEHRFYGKSVPTATLSASDLKTLTLENALADMAAFQAVLSTTLGLTGKVVTIGGSYPGALSAYYRQKYPNLVAGALASSGPVRAKENFEEYDLHVSEVAGPACAQAMRDIAAEVENRLKDPTEAKKVRQLFGASAAKITDDDDFLYLIADIGAGAVQYGDRDKLCNAITAPSLDAAGKLGKYSAYALQMFQDWGMNAFEFSLASAFDENPNSYLNGFGMRSWLYQSCQEFGFFQNAYHDPAVTTRSMRINPAYHQKLCQRLFSLTTPVKEVETNAAYYQPLLDAASASKIFFTNGQEDPWSLLSINHDLGNDTNSLISAQLIPNAAHCDDLGSPSIADPSPLAQARATFLTLAKDWLK